MNLSIFEIPYGYPFMLKSMEKKEERSDTMSEKEQDWELSDDYYHSNEQGKNLSLEYFITESEKEEDGFSPSGEVDELLKKTIEDVHKVLALAQEGKSIAQIASITGLLENYVYDIQVCAQGFREDDEIAVAHLVLG